MDDIYVPEYSIKYNEIYILPWHLHYVSNPDALYKCIGGEVVKMEYLKEYHIDIDEDYWELNELCHDLFNLDFSVMRAIWAKRRPDLPLKLWFKVKMHLQWK